MTLAYNEFKVENSDVPGDPRDHIFWGSHASGMCRLQVYRPDGWDTTGFQNAPWLLLFHGGYGHNPGDRATNPSSFSDEVGRICSTLSGKGWVIMSADYPPCPSNESSEREMFATAMFPDQYLWACRAIQFVKDHGSLGAVDEADLGVVGNLHFARKMLGQNAAGITNTLDPNRGGTLGRSHGGLLALWTAYAPDALVRAWSSTAALTNDPRAARSSHRPAFAASLIGQVDWSQYYVDTGTANPLGPIYHSNRHQQFHRRDSGESWSHIPMWLRKAASPYHLLLNNFPENRTMPVWAKWGGSESGEGANWGRVASGVDAGKLEASDWRPGKVALDGTLKKTFWDPHHAFQGYGLERAIKAEGRGDARSRIIWGNTTWNPNGDNVQGMLNGSESEDFVDWVENTVGITAP